jgi:hypothetical protein
MRALVAIALFFVVSQLGFAQISGLVFADYYYNVAFDTANYRIPNAAIRGEKDANGFQFRRVNFSYDYTISESFSTRFRVEAEDAVTTPTKRYSVFLKDMWLRWKYAKGHEVIVGMQPPPAFEVSEFYWKFRSLERTILDFRGIVSSRDIGVSLKGSIDQKSVVRYWAMFGNGSGVTPESDKFKRYYAHLHFRPFENLEATIYGDLRNRDRKADPLLAGETLPNNDFTTALFIGYMKKDHFAAGIEGIMNTRQNEFASANGLKSRIQQGVSVFGSYEFSDLLGLLFRYDWFDPNTDLENDTRNVIIGGANIKLNPMVAIIPNIMVETYQSAPGVSFDPSVVARITFNYRFL